MERGPRLAFCPIPNSNPFARIRPTRSFLPASGPSGGVDPTRNRKFEPISVQRRVSNEPGPRRAPPESISWFTCRMVPSGKEADERSQRAAA
jgi:hypothetical protein